MKQATIALSNFAKQQPQKLMPKNRLGISNVTVLKAAKAYPWFSMPEGFEFPVYFDGEWVRFGSLTWDIGQLCDEIEAGLWEIAA